MLDEEQIRKRINDLGNEMTGINVKVKTIKENSIRIDELNKVLEKK